MILNLIFDADCGQAGFIEFWFSFVSFISDSAGIKH